MPQKAQDGRPGQCFCASCVLFVPFVLLPALVGQSRAGGRGADLTTRGLMAARFFPNTVSGHRLIFEKLLHIEVVAIAEFHVDHRRILALPLFAVFACRLPIVFVVIFRRRPEMELHLTARTCNCDSCGAQFFYFSNDKEYPDMVLNVARTGAPASNHFAR